MSWLLRLKCMIVEMMIVKMMIVEMMIVEMMIAAGCGVASVLLTGLGGDRLCRL